MSKLVVNNLISFIAWFLILLDVWYEYVWLAVEAKSVEVVQEHWVLSWDKAFMIATFSSVLKRVGSILRAAEVQKKVW